MQELKLYMVLIGCRPAGRLTEQHDIFFGIAPSMAGLIPSLKQSWPEAKGVLHIDAWRHVKQVGDYRVHITNQPAKKNSPHLFFLNLGGYKQGEFDEFHYKMVVADINKAGAVKQGKQTAFYKHTGFKGAASHIDDKFGIDVDEVHEIKDILPASDWHVHLTKEEGSEDELHLGYFKLDTFK